MPTCIESGAFVIFAAMAGKLKTALFDLEDRLFEKRHGLELGGVIPREKLIADDHNSVAHATAYHAVWCRNLRKLLTEARKTGGAFRHFIDIGSGKGKACFYASRDSGFEQITGVEFSKPLVDIAEANRKKFRSRNISFVYADAAQFLLPDAPVLVFMFNPFDGAMMQRFVNNNIDHFRKRKSVIAYANDKERESLAACGFTAIFREPAYKISLHRYGA
jgi:SAM-dependent methyltransferase